MVDLADQVASDFSGMINHRKSIVFGVIIFKHSVSFTYRLHASGNQNCDCRARVDSLSRQAHLRKYVGSVAASLVDWTVLVKVTSPSSHIICVCRWASNKHVIICQSQKFQIQCVTKN